MSEIAIKLLEVYRDSLQIQVDALNDAIKKIKTLDEKP